MIRPAPDGVLIDVRVQPRSSRPGVAGTRAGALLVRLQSPPTDGAANAELLVRLAAALGVPKSALTIVNGHASRQKRVHVAGIGALEAVKRLTP